MASIPITRGGRPAHGSAEAERTDTVSAAVLGGAGLALSAAFMVGLHWSAPARLSLLSSPMSDYALADGVGWMFGVSVVGIAAGGFGATLALARAGLLSTALLRLAMGLTVISALVTAAFPTDEALPLSLTGQIHRYGAITMLCCVPIAGMLVAVALPAIARRRAWLQASSSTAACLMVLFLLSHLATMPAEFGDLRGLLQRLTVMAELVVLAQLCVVSVREASEGHGGVSVGNGG